MKYYVYKSKWDLGPAFLTADVFGDSEGRWRCWQSLSRWLQQCGGIIMKFRARVLLSMLTNTCKKNPWSPSIPFLRGSVCRIGRPWWWVLSSDIKYEWRVIDPVTKLFDPFRKYLGFQSQVELSSKLKKFPSMLVCLCRKYTHQLGDSLCFHDVYRPMNEQWPLILGNGPNREGIDVNFFYVCHSSVNVKLKKKIASFW